MKLMALHFSTRPAPELAVRPHPLNDGAADITIGDVEHTVFRPSRAELRAWLEDFRAKVDGALADLADAPAAPAPEDALRALTGEFTEWCAANNLPEEGSVDDLLARPDLTGEQREWLTGFKARWEAAQQAAEILPAAQVAI